MNLPDNEIIFLTKEEVLIIHKECIEKFGGTDKIRDLNLLDSALNQPKQSFNGKYLYDSVYKMAAAYLFFFSKNHAFIDGNKRTGLKCCLIFLMINGHKLLLNNDEAIDLTEKCVIGKYKFDDIVKIIEDNTILK